MFNSIEAIAKEISVEAERTGYADADFCKIAATHLARPLDFDMAALAMAVCDGAALPPQRRLDEGFGQPAITLYRGARFTVEALFWHSGTPAIHQHAFSGAFRILAGRSVHSRYKFTERGRLGRVVLGDLTLDSVEVLKEGATVAIPRGAELIHANFHLDSPTVTLVVRTHQGPEPEPTYLPPGVAYDPAARSASLHKRIQLLDTLHQTGHAEYLECVNAAIDRGDEYDAMSVVMRAGARVEAGEFRALTARLERRHGGAARRISEALLEERRRGMIVRTRAGVTDPDVRFFLACLLSFTRREEILRAMEAHYAGATAARQRVCQGVTDLLGGDPDRQAVTTAATDAILSDIGEGRFAEWAARQWERPFTSNEAAALERYYMQLAGHPLLTPLVSV